MKTTTLSLLNYLKSRTGAIFQEDNIDNFVSKKDFGTQRNSYVIDNNKNIIGLNLASLKLTDISFLGKLPGLEYLILKENQIQNINILEHLKQLAYLNLEDNQLTDVSSTLGRLRNLSKLYLRRNYISDISFLKNLNFLVALDFSENEVSDVSIIKDLLNLRELDMDLNKINYLPREIPFLKNLVHLSILGNPLEEPPARYTYEDLEGIREFYHPKKVFISYARDNKEWLIRVQKHFRAANINFWDDTQIEAGILWKEEIRNALESTKIAVLLISTDFIASDFIKDEELPILLDAAKSDRVKIISLMLMPARIDKVKGLAKIQMINDPIREPLIDLPEGEQEKILIKLTKRIESLLGT